MRKVVVLALCFIICAVFSACSKDDSKSVEGGGNNNPTDVVSTGDVENGMTYAIIKGTVNLSVLNIGSSSIDYGAEVSISENFTNSSKNTTRNIEGNLLEIKINNLKSNVKYYYRAFIKTNGNTYYGKTKSFTTKELKNVTTTGGVDNITLSSAVVLCDVNLTTLDDKESIRLGVAYSLSKDIPKKDVNVESYVNSHNANEGHYSMNIRGLQPATTYYYFSYTSDGEKYIFGETKSFTTLSNDTFEYLNTSEAVDISGRSATLRGWSKLESLYNGNSIRYYFDYSDNYEIVANRSQYIQQTMAQINSGELSAHISSLSENTKYYYRIVAKENNIIVAEGEILSFTTTPYEAQANIASAPVTATTDAAKKLYTFLRNQYGQSIISSVMADVAWNNSLAEKVNTLTGKYPAMNCYDFIHIQVPDGNGWIDYSNTKPVTNWANAGGIVQLMWHFNVPKSETTTIETNGSGVTCSPNETTFKASNALKDGTWENKYFYGQMDRVIAVILKLQDAGIAATWRPFHEAAGNATAKQQASWTKAWFWWGYDGPETFKSLWKAMFDYFKQKGVNNLIWIWTTQNYNGNSSSYNQDKDWYPGDSYCDMVARDLYGYTAAQNAQEFKEIQATYPNKMIVLGECGWDSSNKTGKPQGRMSDCWNQDAKWGHFMVWYDGNAGNRTSTMVSDDWWKDAMSNQNVITRDQVKY